MRLSEAFPSRFLKAGDLDGHEVTVTISSVGMEPLGEGEGSETKLCAFFEGKKKGLVLNKTNAETIGMAYGDETDEWAGKKVILYPAKTQFGGKMVDCIRLRMPPLPVAPEGDEPPF